MSDIDKESAELIALQRWFTVNELDFLLQNFQSIGFSLTYERDTLLPPSGRFYFFPRRTYKTDSYEWVRRKGRDTVREDMVKMSIDGIHVVTGRYTYSLATPGLCRRTYEHTSNGSAICMVHYRLCPLEELPKRAAISSAVSMRDDAVLDDQLVEDLMVCAESMGLAFTDDTGRNASFTGDISRGNSISNSIDMSSSLLNTSSTLFLSPGFSNYIIDFEPKMQFPAGFGDIDGTSVIICLSEAISAADTFAIILGDNEFKVPASWISCYALKFRVPILDGLGGGGRSPLHLRVWSNSGEFITPSSSMAFSFSPPSYFSSSSGLANAPYVTSPCIANTLDNMSTVGGGEGVDAAKMDETIGMDFTFPLVADGEPSSAPMPNISRNEVENSTAPGRRPELGMRFVEKLGSVAAVLVGNPMSPKNETYSYSFGGNAEVIAAPWSDGWLDDKALSQLSNEQLQKLVDSFIENYMGQLVQLASVDADLRQELNTLDKSGYALMHYCSMYNLTDLVSTLLAENAADVDIIASDGSTPIHVAALSGNSNVVHLLLKHGANCGLVDNEGITAAQRALKAGYTELSVLIEQAVGQKYGEFSDSVLMEEDYDTYRLGSPMFDSSPGGKAVSTSSADNYQDIPDISAAAIFQSPPTRRKSSTGDLSASGSESTGNINILQAALSSLSLTDKCALSLSLGPPQVSPRASMTKRTDAMDFSEPTAERLIPPQSFSVVDSGHKIFEDIVFDSQSVLSESDMESLDVAMSMMGPQELDKVESEVKLIQNNVRAWILRKNYTNLRDAARVLQTAWRVKKNFPHDYISNSARAHGLATVQRKKRRASGELAAPSIPENSVVEFPDESYGSMYKYAAPDNSDKVSSAAATLQAVTRGMLARKTFENAKRQGMASLVIQKSLFNWWVHSKDPARPSHQAGGDVSNAT